MRASMAGHVETCWVPTDVTVWKAGEEKDVKLMKMNVSESPVTMVALAQTQWDPSRADVSWAGLDQAVSLM